MIYIKQSTALAVDNSVMIVIGLSLKWRQLCVCPLIDTILDQWWWMNSGYLTNRVNFGLRYAKDCSWHIDKAKRVVTKLPLQPVSSEGNLQTQISKKMCTSYVLFLFSRRKRSRVGAHESNHPKIFEWNGTFETYFKIFDIQNKTKQNKTFHHKLVNTKCFVSHTGG